jgi:hypothetical protein
LKDGALVAAMGSQITTDPNDPNYSPDAIYIVNGLQRYWVPDPDTLTWLQNHGSTLFNQQDESQGYTPDYVITIPLQDPAVMFPSVVDGALCWRLDDSGNVLTLMISEKTSEPAYYEIQAPDYLARLAQLGIQRTVMNLPCLTQDIRRYHKSDLDPVCQVAADGRNTQNFSDGVREPIPAGYNAKVKTYTITQSGYDGIPATGD